MAPSTAYHMHNHDSTPQQIRARHITAHRITSHRITITSVAMQALVSLVAPRTAAPMALVVKDDTTESVASAKRRSRQMSSRK
eukprot:5117720-Lingulodinium_polyedra.AAC.1